MTTIKIEDGTVPNINEETHKRGKSWVAIVESDKSQPGGLKRDFLQRAPGGRVFIAGITAGDWLEFAGDYYSAFGRKQASRKYFRVVEINGDLVLEECSLEDIGKRRAKNLPWSVEYDNDTGPNDEGFCEWWAVSNGPTSFKASKEEEATRLCEILNRNW